MNSVGIWAAAALLATSPLAAQQQQHQAQAMPGTASGGMEHCQGMVAGPQPSDVLGHREHLALTATQVARLEELAAQGAAAVPHMQSAMQAHGELAKILDSDRPDLAAYEARLRAAAEQMVQGHLAQARLAVRTRTVLSARQRQQLASMTGAATAAMPCPMMGGGSGAASTPKPHSH